MDRFRRGGDGRVKHGHDGSELAASGSKLTLGQGESRTYPRGDVSRFRASPKGDAYGMGRPTGQGACRLMVVIRYRNPKRPGEGNLMMVCEADAEGVKQFLTRSGLIILGTDGLPLPPAPPSVLPAPPRSIVSARRKSDAA